MKIKDLILLSLLLAVLVMGSACAADEGDSISCDNMTADSTESQNDGIASDFQDEQVLKDSGSEIDMRVSDVSQNVSYSKYASCHVDISNQDAQGTLYVYIDEMSEYSYGYTVSGPVSAMFQSENYVKDFRTHFLFVKYVDSSGNYADKVLNFTFEVNDYDLSLSDSYGDAVLGQDYSIGMSLPFDAKGTLIVTHNGVDYEIPPEAYYWRITIPGERLLLGRNEVRLHFIPSPGCKLPEKTTNDSFNAISKIIGFTSSTQIYGEVGDVSLTLPEDAYGNLAVRSQDNSFFRSARLENGRAVISLRDLNCGNHHLIAEYVSSDYYDDKVADLILDFSVVPKITIPVFAHKGKSTFQVEVVMPETITGHLYVRNSFNNEVKNYPTAKGTMTIDLATPNSDTRVTVRYYLGDMTYEREYYVGTRMNSPEFEMNITASDALKGRDLYVDIGIPSGYGAYEAEPFDGYFVLYIDNVEAAKSMNTWIFHNTGALDIGTHQWRVEFQNDCYYSAQAKSGTFDVGYFSCDIGENINLEHNNIVVRLASDATGMLTLLVDGEECDTKIITDYIMLLKLPDSLSIAEHDVEVRYMGNYPDASKSGRVNVDYPLVHVNDFADKTYAYGEPVTVTVNAPKNATGNVIISMGDRNYTLELKDGSAQMTLTDLECGNYNVTARYEGDSTYPPKTDSCTFTVEGYAIFGPQQNYIYYGDDESITLALPGGEGNLIVKLDDNVYQSVRLQDGKASVSLGGIAPGVHKLNAYYSAGDYAVNPYDRDIFHVDIRVLYPINVNVGEDTWIYLRIPENAQGGVIMNLKGETMELIHSNGIINKTFALSEFGDYDFTLMYNGADYNINLPDGRIHVKPGNLTYPSTITDEDNAISFNIPSDAKGNVSVYAYDDVSGQYSTLVLQENVSGPVVSVSLSDLKSGRYDLKIIYEDEKYGNFSQGGIYLSVPNPAPTISVSVSGDEKSATFTFSLPKDASGALIVKVEGRSYYCKINDGKANLTIENLAGGSHTILVQYGGCDNYSATAIESNVTVAKYIPARIAAGDASVIYSSGNRYSVTVYARGGALAKNVEVLFKVNGKKVATVKTDSNGVARYKIVQKPGSYKITAQALGKTITKKLTVKHVLKLKKVKIKRSAKKLVIKATLVKVNGKYLKGKRIILKFKGKKYKAKTNSKGVAKFTIKKNVLKKLKKGKKVTYQAIYLKDTVKYKVKVKK